MQSTVQTEPTSSAGYAGSNSGGEKSPVDQLQLLKNLNNEKKQTKDGQTPKRRGPKPDSKPALTRRQELNRQAQRTHRERKEMYIKALEQEVIRLKDVFAESSQERDKVQQENQRLKALLRQHGISYDFGESPVKFKLEGSNGPSSSGSISGSYHESTGFSPPAGNGVNPAMQNMQGNIMQQHQVQQRTNAMLPNSNMDYDNIGIDFVLTLERPCMEHMQYLVVRSHNSDGQDFRHPSENKDDRDFDHMSGHALMASCPSHAHVMEKPNEPYPLKTLDVGGPDLRKLLDLSTRLPLNHESEITPIMAWTMIYRDPRISELSVSDFERIKNDLFAKVRCYGFGAVLEEFEVHDAVGTVFAERDSLMAMDTNGGQEVIVVG